jgi:hypothetical protein
MKFFRNPFRRRPAPVRNPAPALQDFSPSLGYASPRREAYSAPAPVASSDTSLLDVMLVATLAQALSEDNSTAPAPSHDSSPTPSHHDSGSSYDSGSSSYDSGSSSGSYDSGSSSSFDSGSSYDSGGSY